MRSLRAVRSLAVLAGEADRPAARLVDVGDDGLVDEAAEHHLHHLHGLLVGHPHAPHELALLADPGEPLADLGPAAVHDHRVHADALQEHDVAGEASGQVVLHHRVPAVLDDEGGAGEALDVGERLGEHARHSLRDGR